MKQKIIGYINIEHLPMLIQEDAKALDVINLAFGVVKDGEVVCDMKGMESFLEKAKIWNPDLKVVLSVGGWGAGGFSEAASTEEGRKLFAATAIQIVEKYKLDGLDIDWEYPCIGIAGIGSAPQDRVNYTRLLETLRKELDSKTQQKGILSVAVGGDAYFIRCTEMEKAVQYLDYVQLMSYDLRGGYQINTGHHTNLYSNQIDYSEASVDHGVKIYQKAGVPKEKLIIGAAFYSRMWKGVPDHGNGWMQMAESTGGYGPDFGELKEKYIEKNGFVRVWDDEAKAPYLFDGNTFISYDDEESIAAKVDYLKEMGLGGIMFWEYGCDKSHTLMRVLAQKLGKE